jgi:hypothetical protein
MVAATVPLRARADPVAVAVAVVAAEAAEAVFGAGNPTLGRTVVDEEELGNMLPGASQT